MNDTRNIPRYFPFEIQITRRMWEQLGLKHVLAGVSSGWTVPPVLAMRQIAMQMNSLPERQDRPVSAGQLNLYALLLRVYRHVINRYADQSYPGILEKTLEGAGFGMTAPEFLETAIGFARLFPGDSVLTENQLPETYVSDDPDGSKRTTLLKELLLLRVAAENRALDSFRELLDDSELAAASPYRKLLEAFEESLRSGPRCEPLPLSLTELLRAPLKASPDSLAGQVGYIREQWREILPEHIITEILVAVDVVKEEERAWFAGPGPSQVLEFGPAAGFPLPDEHYPEPEQFSADVDWMPNVVLLAKMVYVWLGQLAKQYEREITRLDQIPEEELDRLARWGFTGLWLIGIWERSPASRKIKQLTGNPDAISSAYSLFDYQIADDLGGWEALGKLRDRALKRGIRLASDMVPNHTGIYSRWTIDHPDWFVQLDYPPYPAYTFNGPDLSFSPEISVHIEDGYWDKRDAGVVFKHFDHRDGRTRYMYHGNDGTSTPWNDTAQLDYLNPEVREAVIRTILHVARNFPIIRFDAAMTLAKKHFQRLWFPQPGLGSGVPSRAEHGMSRAAFDAAMPEEFWRQVVDRVAAEVPDTLLLAEAFWLMEGYFVRTLGMHRVYNSAFMNMLKQEENSKYRQTIKNVLEFNHEIMKRFVNFMNNPDEKTAVEQFGKEKKYFGASLLLVTMPGLPMIGHGQVEGFHEKYGMEYKRAYWDEPVDEHLVTEHERLIFPLMRRRRLFSGSENFVLYDFFVEGTVNEDVFAYSNRFGNERGLILYHNKFASTAGWIRMSTSRAVKIDSGETVLTQTTLSNALGFNPDGRYYYVFRDYVSGLEYIRNGRELAEKGLFVELEAYEFHAFLDFREIRDDDFGTWGKLCYQLHGRPVTSMDEEVKQVRFAEVVAPFGEALYAIMIALADLSDKKLSAAAAQAVDRFLSALQGRIDETAVFDSVASSLPGFLEAAAGLILPVKADKVAKGTAAAPATDPVELLMVASCLLIVLADGLEPRLAETPSSRFMEFGLNRVVADRFDLIAGVSRPLHYPTGKEMADVFGRLFSHREFPESDENCFADLVLNLLEKSEIRRFLLCHTSKGVEWFVKERIEFLVNAVVLIEDVMDIMMAKEKVQGQKLNTLKSASELVCNAAATAGYRMDLFREGLGGKKRGPEIPS